MQEIHQLMPMLVCDGPKLFCDVSAHNHFQVAIFGTLDALEAKAQALLLGAKLPAALNLQVANMLTICLVSAVRFSLRQNPGHWSLRPIVSEFTETSRGRQFSMIKIKREANKTADELAK